MAPYEPACRYVNPLEACAAERPTFSPWMIYCTALLISNDVLFIKLVNQLRPSVLSRAAPYMLYLSITLNS